MAASLLERAQREGTPLIDGSNATFVWQGEGVIPQLVGDFTGWFENPLDLTEVEPGVWVYTVALPRDAYVEYGFATRFDIVESFADPFNARLVYNGTESVNHYFTMPDYQSNPWIRRKPGVERGTVSEHWLETRVFTADTHRKIYLYRPPVDEPTPLVIVWDGQDYLFRGRLNAIVDNLIAEGRIRPIALAFIQSHQDSRFVEYMQGEASIGMVTQLVLPLAAEHLNLIDWKQNPGVHGALGASMGGLEAFYMGLRASDVFGHIICQSGAFWFGDPQYDMLAVELVKHAPVRPMRLWQDVGTLEFLLEGNRAMHRLLEGKGYNVTYREFSGGHNQTMWADNTWRALEALYGK